MGRFSINDIVKKIDDDVFFKIVEIFDNDSYTGLLVNNHNTKKEYTIRDEQIELFMKPTHPNYTLPPILILGTVSNNNLLNNFDNTYDYYQERLKQFTKYNGLKFFRDNNKCIIYGKLKNKV